MKNSVRILGLAALVFVALVGCQKETSDSLFSNPSTDYVMFKGGPGGSTTVDTVYVAEVTVSSISQIVTKGKQAGFGFPTYVGEGAKVIVLNKQGLPVQGVLVSGTWSGCFGGSKSATTDAGGVATVSGSSTMPSNCTATFTVLSLSKSVVYYDATLNVTTSGSKVYL